MFASDKRVNVPHDEDSRVIDQFVGLPTGLEVDLPADSVTEVHLTV